MFRSSVSGTWCLMVRKIGEKNLWKLAWLMEKRHFQEEIHLQMVDFSIVLLVFGAVILVATIISRTASWLKFIPTYQVCVCVWILTLITRLTKWLHLQCWNLRCGKNIWFQGFMFLPVKTHSSQTKRRQRTVPAITLAEEQLENDAKDA